MIDIIKLGELCNKITDGTHHTPTYTNEGIPFLRVTDITKSNNSKKFISHEEHLELIKRCNPEKGDILYTKNGTIGVAKQIDWDYEFSIFVSLCLLKIKEELVDANYLVHYLNTKYALKQALIHSKKATISNLHLVEIKKIKIPLPPLPQQKKIATILDIADDYRQKTKSLITKYDELAQSLFLDMFWDTFKDKNSHTPISELANFIDYRGKTLKKIDNGVPYITAKCVRIGYFNLSRIDYISRDSYEKIMTRGYPKVGDVLFTTEGATMGFTCRIPANFTEFSVGQRLITLQTTKEYNSTVLEFMLNSKQIQAKIFRLATGSAVKGIRAAKFKTIEIPVPPIELQNQFAERVQAIEAQKVQVQTSLAKAEDLFNCLLQKAFNGELV